MQFRRLFFNATLAALIVPGVEAGSLKTNEIVITGGNSESDGLSATGMSLWLKKGEPGVAFGMARQPGKAPEYGYVLLIKGDADRKNLPSFGVTSTSDGRVASGGGNVEINGHRAEIAYSLNLAKVETMTINGKAFDLSKGRVFLIDLNEKEAKVQQVQVVLPSAPALPTRAEDVDRLAKGHIKQLRKDSVAVREFLK
jgi:hypothetical protein